MSASYYNQVVLNYRCGSFNEGLKSSNPEQESLTNLVLFKLVRAKQLFPTEFGAHVSKPSLQNYLDKLSCPGDQLSNAEALYIEGQIELMYVEAEAA